MAECHKCRFNGLGNPICIRCPGPADTNHHGQTHISMDAGADAQTFGEVEASLRRVAQPEIARELPEIDAARRVLAEFMALSDPDLRLVRALMRGESMAAFGKTEGLTRAAVSWRVKQIAKKHPVFSFLRSV